MVKAIKVIVIIKKYKSCEDKELKLKNFSLRACIPGRPQPHPPTPHCLSKLVLQNINKTELINIFGEVELKIRLKYFKPLTQHLDDDLNNNCPVSFLFCFVI